VGSLLFFVFIAARGLGGEGASLSLGVGCGDSRFGVTDSYGCAFGKSAQYLSLYAV